MYSSKHFEATGGHIGTPGPAFFAGLGVLSIPTTHTNSAWFDARPNLIRVEVKLLEFTGGVGKAVKQSWDANLLLILEDVYASTEVNIQLW